MSEGRGKGPRPALGDVDLSDMPGPILQPDPEEVRPAPPHFRQEF